MMFLGKCHLYAAGLFLVIQIQDPNPTLGGKYNNDYYYLVEKFSSITVLFLKCKLNYIEVKQYQSTFKAKR